MTWLLTVLIVYGAIVAAVFAFQRNLQYFPSQVLQSAEEGTGGLMQTVTYRTGDGLDLQAWYRRPDDGLPTLVMFHGNGGQHGHRAPSMLPYMERGYGVLLAGYRGYGGNPGSPTEDGFYADGRAALDWLATQGTGPGAVVLYGESLGSGVAVQMAAERPVAGLMLQAPFTSAVDVGQVAYRWLPVQVADAGPLRQSVQDQAGLGAFAGDPRRRRQGGAHPLSAAGCSRRPTNPRPPGSSPGPATTTSSSTGSAKSGWRFWRRCGRVAAEVGLAAADGPLEGAPGTGGLAGAPGRLQSDLFPLRPAGPERRRGCWHDGGHLRALRMIWS